MTTTKSKAHWQQEAEATKKLIKDLVEEKVDIPDEAIVFTDLDQLLKVLTRKRLELLNYIKAYHPESIQQLADLLQRKKQAVDRDLKILERYEVVELQKEGKIVCPVLKREIAVINLAKPLPPLQIEAIQADVYIKQEKINEVLLETPWKDNMKRKVIKVINGTTFIVSKKIDRTNIIKLAGLHIPNALKRQATIKLKRLIEGKNVTIIPKGRKTI